MEGLVTSYSGTTLVINVDTISGSGTVATWSFNVAGNVGAAGAAGATGATGATGSTGGGGMMWITNIFTNYQYSYTSMFAPPGIEGDPTYGQSYTTTATNSYIQPLGSCTLDSMLVINYTNNTSIPVTVEAYVNGTGQAGLKCTAAAGIGTACSVTGQSVAVVSTDKVSLGITTTSNFNVPSSTGSFLGGGFYIALHCK
jgi:hypothetical protein